MQLNGSYNVKLGKSFRDPDAQQSYVTMRCDFMPASVDRSQPGSIRVNDAKEVVVQLPNVAPVGTTTVSSTVFRGSARPVQKECILIYNKRTGELTLERIANAVQLKKTREERKPAADTELAPPSKPAHTPGSSNSAQSDATRSKQTTSSPTKKTKTGVTLTNIGANNRPTHGSNESSRCQQARIVRSSEGKTGRTLSSSSSGSDSEDNNTKTGTPGKPKTAPVPAHHSRMDTARNRSSDSSSEDESLSSGSSSSSLSSLSDCSAPAATQASPMKKGKALPAKGKHSSVSQNAASATNHGAVVQSANRRLIEHDLKLSDSDSDDSDE